MYGSKHEEIDLNPSEYVRSRIDKFSKTLGRFPESVDFTNKVVLDVGSGFGALSILAAKEGAQQVIGIDPDPVSVEIANFLISNEFPELASRIVFHCGRVEDLSNINADAAVSLAVFEHVQSPEKELRDLRFQIKKGGKIYLGIGPLFYAPWGDHGRLNAPLSAFFPWAHLSFPKRWLLSRVHQTNGSSPAMTLQDLGLNGLKLPQYLEAFEQSGFNLDWYGTNCHEFNGLSNAINAVSRLPFLRDLLTFNIYAVLRNH